MAPKKQTRPPEAWRPAMLMTLVFLLACMPLFSACATPFSKKTIPLREPPFVPGPPENGWANRKPPPASVVNRYADTEAIQKYSEDLGQAVTKALRLGVLRPATLDERFEAEQPISYGEFRSWANNYQSALNTQRSLAGAMVFAPDVPEQAAGPMAMPLAVEEAAQTWLPVEMAWEGYGVQEQTMLNRETLCALAVFLNRQDEVAKKLTPYEILNAQPGMAEPVINSENDSVQENLSHLSDFKQISPWAQRYVAMAYRNDWLDPMFGLTATQVIADEGLQPERIVSRAEAMLLLDLIYQHGLPPSPPQPAAGVAKLSENDTKPKPGKATPGVKPSDKPQQKPTGPMQLKKQQPASSPKPAHSPAQKAQSLDSQPQLQDSAQKPPAEQSQPPSTQTKSAPPKSKSLNLQSPPRPVGQLQKMPETIPSGP